MSVKHPIIAVTGSSGAGTTTVMKSFTHIFRREGINAQIVEGDAFHRYDRAGMRAAMQEHERDGKRDFSHFGPGANLLRELEELFASYGREGSGRYRHYVHDEAEAVQFGQEAGTFTAWEEIAAGTDLLFYEGLHGAAVVADVEDVQIDIARHADLLVGVVPIINLEWIQKLHRDQTLRGYSHEAVVDTILRRMPDYVNHICPQFSRTHVNFQRVPTVDTSNPFIAREIPQPDESFVVIRFARPRGIDFQYLLTMLHDSFMSRPNVIVVPGGKMGLAMQLIFTPMILQLMDRRARA
ncbi:phosphoribulokinase [Trinickia sp. Y13]|uniref:phosphoribulokinase n=1 Tax=Trinickia sp. Y13 TaxID=2917807 RepID=UPI0024076978|nr:phosphoribulokinase [Trinickia sp. Y13]MDG0023869.1 phosphoribulokinase [Trinickia sp. Y13]